MRKTYHFLFSCILAIIIGILPILASAQDNGADTLTRKEKRQQFERHLFVNLNAGVMFNYTDIGRERYAPPTDSWRLGYGGAIGYQAFPIWGIRAKITSGKLHGESKEDTYWLITRDPRYRQVFYDAKIYDYHLDLTINISNALFGYKSDRFLDLYAVGGGGFAEWNSKAYYSDSVGERQLIYENSKFVNATTDPDFPGYGAGFGGRYRVLEANGGLGVNIHIIPALDANVEYELKFLDTDLMDNFRNGEQPIKVDMFGYLSAGLTYKFLKSDPLKKMKKDFNTVTFKAEPNPLEAHGGKVPVKITGTFPEDYFSPKAAMHIEPYMVCDGNRIPLKPILLKGTEVGGEGIVISKDGGSFTYETVVDYDENCRVAELVIEPVIFVSKTDLPADLTNESILANYKKSIELPEVKLADGTIITGQKFAFSKTSSIVPHGYVKENILTKDAKIYFEVNRYNLNWNVPLNKVDANKAKLTELFDFIGQGYKIKSINIDGWASPEGEETLNQGLSENRTKTANTYIIDKIKGLIKAKETKLVIKDAAKDVQYNLVHHGPDWNGFINSLQNSDIKEKNSILNVINSAGTPAKKEQEIRNMIKIYPEIEALLAPLRRAEIVVSVFEPKKTDEEMIALSTSNPRGLDEKELLYAASLQTDKKTRLDIYKSDISIYPDSYKGYANAGAIEIEMGDMKAAKAHLEKAASLNPNSGEVHNNLGIIYGIEGNYAKAEEHFTKAGQLGTDATYNLGVISIHKGEYAKALSQFGSKTCDYNVALAYIASKNYPPAEKQLSCAPKDAQTHYLMAILGSRTANTSMMYENLGKAIQLDAAYKTEAKIDREFIKYFADPSFTSLVN